MARGWTLAVAILGALVASDARAQGPSTPPRLLSASVPPSPWSVQSGGIAAFDVAIDDKGSVTAADVVQDVAPYSALLGEALRGWRFEPARAQGRAAPSHVLVLGFFRPPDLTVVAPDRPRYKDTTAPEHLPWPTSVTVPPYPPNAMGSGKVILEVDVSEEGRVTAARVLTPASAFDDAATGAARAWAFRPAAQAGRAAAARAYFVFSFIGTTR
jgi:TonB family protein